MYVIKPTLCAVKGYVEIEVDGVRRYKNIETGEIVDGPIEEDGISPFDQIRADVDFLLTLDGHA